MMMMVVVVVVVVVVVMVKMVAMAVQLMGGGRYTLGLHRPKKRRETKTE
jgi:hypothetical protein